MKVEFPVVFLAHNLYARHEICRRCPELQIGPWLFRELPDQWRNHENTYRHARP